MSRKLWSKTNLHREGNGDWEGLYRIEREAERGKEYVVAKDNWERMFKVSVLLQHRHQRRQVGLREKNRSMGDSRWSVREQHKMVGAEANVDGLGRNGL